MSKFVWYNFEIPSKYSNLDTLINWLPNNLQEKYNAYKLCCDDANLYLPQELWASILHLLCEPKNTQNDDIITTDMLDIVKQQKLEIKEIVVEPKDILNWYDNYISNPALHENNPVFLSENSYACIIYLSVKHNFNHSILLHTINNTGNNEFNIPRLGDLFLGIQKNPNIISIQIDMYNVPSYKIKAQDLYEFKFAKMYTHTLSELDDICSGHDMLEIYKQKYIYDSEIYWSFRDIMPISLLNALCTVKLTVETVNDIPLDDIKILYGFIAGYNRSKMCALPLEYKNIIYGCGMVSDKSTLQV